FIVANKVIREKIVLVKQSVDLHTPVLPQLIVEKYLASGRLKDRIPAISYTYGQRCASLMKALDEYAGEDLEYQKPVGGMFLWARLKNGMSATKLLNYAKDAGVVFVPGAAFYAEGADDSTLRLSFATVNPEGTIEAAKRLAVAIQKYKESN
ncbi:MAG: aminotransferase class I/II-fold pyridoxal phosphate-dependent enzyme, partial [Wohlfahrtiimonas sp.]